MCEFTHVNKCIIQVIIINHVFIFVFNVLNIDLFLWENRIFLRFLRQFIPFWKCKLAQVIKVFLHLFIDVFISGLSVVVLRIENAIKALDHVLEPVVSFELHFFSGAWRVALVWIDKYNLSFFVLAGYELTVDGSWLGFWRGSFDFADFDVIFTTSITWILFQSLLFKKCDIFVFNSVGLFHFDNSLLLFVLKHIHRNISHGIIREFILIHVHKTWQTWARNDFLRKILLFDNLLRFL